MENGGMMGSLQNGILDLANKLRQERLFITSEQQHLHDLNEKVVKVSSQLAELAWVTAQQRDNLNCLIVSRPDCSPASCSQKANSLENTRFLDGSKVLGYQECLSYGALLSTLRTSPTLLAACLAAGDLGGVANNGAVVHSLAAGLFGSAHLRQDSAIVLRLLRHLTRLQLATADNPRSLLRKKSCAFARLYAEFTEGLFPGKLFLTAALHEPIMQLLVDHDDFLDIEPDKAAERFNPEERLRRFGTEGNAQSATRLAEHRSNVVDRLVVVTMRFLTSLRQHMHCFPAQIGWLVRHINRLLSRSPHMQPKEVSAMCTELVLTHFVCPAIVSPEPHGITDAPISPAAGFNLIQVAKIVQTLAMSRHEHTDPRLADLYSRFDQESVCGLLDGILEEEGDECPDSGDPGVDGDDRLPGLVRAAALFTERELHMLVDFLNAVIVDPLLGTADKQRLTELLSALPPSVPPPATQGQGRHGNGQQATPPESNRKMAALLGKVGKSRPRPPTVEPADDRDAPLEAVETVLVIPFELEPAERVGFLSENKVLRLGEPIAGDEAPDDIPPPAERDVEGSGVGTQKRARAFSHDDGSIGNASDNLEAASEAASNHSVASSLELEPGDQNDNLSDMVSANVSGRGSPNISGRDTPSSQVTEGEDVGGRGGAGGEVRPLDSRPPPAAPSKQSRSDIDDKFCKFEIKKLLEGDETVMSMVSDTWSTDVLASDSETVEQPEPRGEHVDPAALGSVLEAASEAASEAWSMDVLPSDSERLTEVDTDDTGSVAPSDDTARSEIEDTPPQPHPTAHGGGFRPIASVPPRGGVEGVWNVTGRGGGAADIRRRVVEYVDSNRRDREAQPNAARPNAFRNAGPVDSPRKPSSVPPSNPSTSTQTTSELMPPPALLQSTMPLANGCIPSSMPLANGCISSPIPLANGVLPSMALANDILSPIPLANGCIPSTLVLTNELISPMPLANGGLGLTNPGLSSSTQLEVEGKLDATDELAASVRLSSASLASTSSSGSGSEPMPPRAATPTPAVPANRGAARSSEGRANTGAIPKSISFDQTAEKGDRDLLDDDGKHKRSFFRNFKLSFKNRRGKSLRGSDDLARYESAVGVVGAVGSGDTSVCSDDILAKYRGKGAVLSEGAEGAGGPSGAAATSVEGADSRLTIDPLRVEESFAFADAKRKLRLALSTADLQHWPQAQGQRGADEELLLFLHLQLAEAINLQDRQLVAHLQETVRCIRLFDSDGCRKLFQSLREDYQHRAPYASYLVRSRQGLLSTIAHLDRLCQRVAGDGSVCRRFLLHVCVRLFLERRADVVNDFVNDFAQLTLPDEKVDLLDAFLRRLAAEMEADPVWIDCNEWQLSEAQTAASRALIGRVYGNAMFPNGDGDVSRDSVLRQHIGKLAAVVTPNHRDLRIPARFQYECPWPSAQAQVAALAAYTTPNDKLQCVLRCAATIMNLLAMAGPPPAADDFTPVLVYVIIKANPPALLSTIQFVESYHGNRMEGEDQYWWTQFCSAVEFIKTMDYNE